MGHLLLALKEVTLVLSDLATIISFTCLVLLNVVFPLLSDWLGHTYFLGLVSRQSFFLISFRLRSIIGLPLGKGLVSRGASQRHGFHGADTIALERSVAYAIGHCYCCFVCMPYYYETL